MAQSLLVQQLLQQMLSGGGQQMLSPLAPVGKIALALAMKNAEKKREASDQKQAMSIADVLSPTSPLAVAPQGQPAPGLAPASQAPSPVQQSFQQNNLVRAMMGGDPALGQQMLLEKYKAQNAPQGNRYGSSPLGIFDRATGHVTQPATADGPKPQSSRCLLYTSPSPRDS